MKISRLRWLSQGDSTKLPLKFACAFFILTTGRGRHIAALRTVIGLFVRIAMFDLRGKRLGMVVGGGPAPGINGVISAVTIEARNRGMEVIGFRDGFQ